MRPGQRRELMRAASRPRGESSVPPVESLISDLRMPPRSRAELERILPAVYADLRALARRYLRRERRNHTLDPTGLVHEAYLRLAQQGSCWQNREHVIAVAAQLMRRILVDHARRKRASRRGGGEAAVTLVDDLVPSPGAGGVDLLAIHEALEELARLDSRQARIVELRFFGGLTVEATAELVGVSVPTVKRDWQTARLFLRHALRSPTPG